MSAAGWRTDGWGGRSVTVITSPGIYDFGAWLEQLLAESTGKDGKGLIPVDGETLGPPGAYGNDRLKAGDYFALLAYVEMNDAHQELLQSIRHAIRNTHHVATCLGFGPRFLHSTGQAYKGGPNTGVFLQITCDDAHDLPVPGQKYTFGIVKAAQARGDFQVLADRKRRALRVHLSKDVRAGLETLRRAVEEAVI